MSTLPDEQRPLSCLHCGEARVEGSYHPLTSSLEHDGNTFTLSAVLTELFPFKEQQYKDATNEGFCERCFACLKSVFTASRSAASSMEEFLSLAKEGGALGFLGDNLSHFMSSNVFLAVAKKRLPTEGVEWFSLVSHNSSTDLACYGSDRGVQFVQQNNDALQEFCSFATGSESTHSGATNATKGISQHLNTKKSSKKSKGKRKAPDLSEKTDRDQIRTTQVQRVISQKVMDDPNNWVCAVCDQTSKRKKHALLHVRVAHKLTGEDVEKCVIDKSLLEHSKKESEKQKSDEDPDSAGEVDDDAPSAKRFKQSSPLQKRKDWECLKCHRLFLWKRNLLSHLRGDHMLHLTEVQKYVQHNKEPGNTVTPKLYFTCANHSWLVFENREDCLLHVKRQHKLGLERAVKMVLKVNVDDSDTEGNEMQPLEEEDPGSAAQSSPVLDECPPLSPATGNGPSTPNSMPTLEAVNTTPGGSDEGSGMPELSSGGLKASHKSPTLKKLWACCLCGHKTTTRDVAKKHLYTNHNMSRRNSERFVKYLGDEDDDENAEDNDFEENHCDDDELHDYYAKDRKNYAPKPSKKKGPKGQMIENAPFRPHKCSICPCRYAHRKDLVRHRRQKHKARPKMFDDDSLLKPPNPLEEEEIPDEPPDDLNLEELSKEKEWACVHCGKKYYRKLDVTRHVKQKHEVGEEKIQAAVIHRSKLPVETWDKLEEPTNDEEEQKDLMLPYVCGMCGVKFKKRSLIYRHLTDKHFLSDKDHEYYIQRNEDFKRRWKCMICGKRYFYRFDVCRHVHRVHKLAWDKTKDSVHYLDEDADLSNEESKGKDFMCARCKKPFSTKRSLVTHIEEFHKSQLSIDNISEFVRDMRKVAHPILDYSVNLGSEITEKIRATELVNYLLRHTKSNMTTEECSDGDSHISSKVGCVEIEGYGSLNDKDWSKICGTSGDLGQDGKKIYRSRKDINKKRFICTMCQRRYYRYKEAQRHLTHKHDITYAESANYISQDSEVAVPDESRPMRIPKRRQVSRSKKFLLQCVRCLRTSAYFETLKNHVRKAHKIPEDLVHSFVCRTSNTDALKLSYEDKMNFICVLCGMTFKNRLDAQAHGPRSHPQYPENDKKKLLFQKTGEDLLYVVHTSKSSGKTKVFWISHSAINQDATIISDEDQDNVRIDEEDLEDSSLSQTLQDALRDSNITLTGVAKTAKDRRMSKAKVRTRETEIEDFLGVMLDHHSQLGLKSASEKEYSLQYSFDDFYLIFSVPGKADSMIKSEPLMNKFWCEFCMRIFKDDESLRNHAGKCQSKAWTKWECLNCKREFEDILAVVEHVSNDYGLETESDVLTYVRSKELMEIPDNGTFLMIDGRSDEEANLLYQSLKGRKAQRAEQMAESSNINDGTDDAASTSTSASSSYTLKEYKPCFICGHRNARRKDLLQHMKEVHHVSGQNNLTDCLECMMHFKTRDELSNHLVSIHNVTIALPTMYNRTCLVCNEVFKSNNALSAHLREYNNNFKCPICEEAFQVYNKLCRHVQKEHSHDGSRSVKCRICPTVLRPLNLEDHMVSHYDRAFGPWSCVVCGKEFVIRKHLREHLKGRHRVFVCFKCGRQFDCLHSFRRHESVHRISAKSRLAMDEYRCSGCNETFVSQSLLKIHKKNNCKQFVCHICGRKMCGSASLASHIRNHQLGKLNRTKKQRTCVTCGKTLSSHAMWKRHQVVHSKQKPNICGICGAKFSFVNALRYHLQKRHPEYKPYNCPVCSQAFLTTHIRNFHVKMVHKDYVDPNRPMKCQYCDCRFKHSVGLRNHMKTKHQDKLVHGQQYFECQNCPRIYKKRKNFIKHSRECLQGEVNADLYNAIRVNVSTRAKITPGRSLLNPGNQSDSGSLGASQYVVTSLPADDTFNAPPDDLETVAYVTTSSDGAVSGDVMGDVELDTTGNNQLVSISDNVITLPGGRQIKFQNDQNQFMEIPSDMLIETTDGDFLIVVSEAGN